jgi:hypothetical protein
LNELAAALNDDATFSTSISNTVATAGSYANSAFAKANTADQRAVTSGAYANSAYIHANAAFAAANTGGGGADFSAIAEDVLPSVTELFDLGSIDKKWDTIHVANLEGSNGVLSTTSDFVAGSLLADDILITNNMIVPDPSTSIQYLGDKGILVVDGNIDVQGDWFKVAVVDNVTVQTPIGGAWTTAGTMGGTHAQGCGVGTQNDALAFGTNSGLIQRYNGTTWSNLSGASSVNTPRYDGGGAGVPDAALFFGGLDTNTGLASNATEEFNGTTWSYGGNMITARQVHSGLGTQNAALAVSGRDASGGNITSTEEYDGSSWSSGASIITALYKSAGTGTQTAALVTGGTITGGASAATIHYDGTTWSSGGNMNQSRGLHAVVGSQTQAVVFGGSAGGSIPNYVTEEYDGTAWSSGGTMINKRANHSGAGTHSQALAIGGTGPAPVLVSEEYNIVYQTTVVTPITTGEEGMIRFNRISGNFEGYNGTSWVALN